MLPLLLLAASVLSAAEPVPALRFLSGEKVVLRVTAADLAKRPNVRVVEVEDPFYGRRMRYRAVPLKDLLTAAYGGSWGTDVLGEVFLEALDGYRAHVPVGKLLPDGAMLAFADADAAEWDVIPGKGTTPAPFYLVWTGSAQRPAAGHPWPWKLESVELGALEEEYPEALPRGAVPESAAGRGWVLFRRSCLSCHAISGDGGTVGPDLNEPRGITRYRSRRFLRAFIRRPSSFRRTKMPDFEELTDRELKDLLSYLDHMTRQAGTR